jgi:hypothetical protein
MCAAAYFAHMGYVTGAVLSAVASLEAAINEVFIDAQYAGSPTFSGVDPSIRKSLTVKPWNKLEGKPILYKYQKALTLAERLRFDQSGDPYKEVDDLIHLRNALVHYKLEWDTNLREHKSIENRLKSRFEPNPYAGETSASFPKKCLGYGCAEWAVKTSVCFIDDSFGRLGLTSIFENFREDLRTG